MKKIYHIIAIAFMFLLGASAVFAQATERDSINDALTKIDPNIVKYFPRWKICEPNLQLQVHQTFLLNGRTKDRLDMQEIIVTAAPKSDPEESYTLLLVECGEEAFAASEVDAYMKKLAAIITDPKRSYCYREIPAEAPMSEKARVQITDFFLPTHVSHSISLSAFEQSLKVGNSGFWLRNQVGNDAIGFPFWTAGMSRIVLQRPLYENDDPETKKPIPYLINLRIGGDYRLRTTGLERGILSFIPQRKLNASNGAGVMSIDISAPFHPQFGLSVNYEPPFSSVPDSTQAEKQTWASFTPKDISVQKQLSDAGLDPLHVVPVLRSTGQVALFYNWWLDPKVPENFFRLDLGLNYVEVQEWGYAPFGRPQDSVYTLTTKGKRPVTGLQTYHPTSFSDWLYVRLEYRSQSTFPFGLSAQYANNNLLVRAYVPLIGEWLYLEGKYATTMHSEENMRPWESKNFFLVSPVLRLNIR